MTLTPPCKIGDEWYVSMFWINRNWDRVQSFPWRVGRDCEHAHFIYMPDDLLTEEQREILIEGEDG